MQVKNATRQSLVGGSITVARTRRERKTGLLKHTSLQPGEGLWIVPCSSVHTFFMKFPIDLVYLDRKKVVRKVRHAVPAWRLSACLTAHSILELPAGAAAAAGVQEGDRLEMEENGTNPITSDTPESRRSK